MKRRTLLLSLAPALARQGALAQAGAAARPLARRIPSSGQEIPALGLGSWITFNVGDDTEARAGCAEVMRHFFASGGRLIDSSPMYGSSQDVIGEGLGKLGSPREVFSADKVWTSSAGAVQVEASRRLWRVARFDLLQVHNLLAWEKQLPLLQAM
ncbi:MAG: aldo/keto reductase, partial [Comamonadaceae bacterium]